MILVSISVMSALSFPYRVGTPRAFINMASLYFYLCGDDTTRVFYISGVVCVKFVNRQDFKFEDPSENVRGIREVCSISLTNHFDQGTTPVCSMLSKALPKTSK